MNSKQGAAKGWLRVFHKGAIMKWVWVVLSVLLLPGLAYGLGDDRGELTTIGSNPTKGRKVA